MAETNGTGVGRPSTKPITERVFDTWLAAYNAKQRFEVHVGKLAKISQKLDEKEIKAVEVLKEKHLENPTGADVKGTVAV